MSLREYVFHFVDAEIVSRIRYVKWCRVLEGEESVDAFANRSIYIAYAYISVENRIPSYCPRIDGAIHYFDESGYIVKTLTKIDLLKELDEMNSDVIDFCYLRGKQKYFKRHQWQLDSSQIQAVIDCIWR